MHPSTRLHNFIIHKVILFKISILRNNIRYETDIFIFALK